MKSSTARRRRKIIQAVIPVLAALCGERAMASPSGAHVVAGAASVSAVGNSLNVHQTSNRAIINWNTFSINPSETVRFIMPSSSSAVLNRVVTLTPSEIGGVLSSNGNVYLINPSGILVSRSGVINVQSFLASSLDVSNSSFMSGGSLLFSGNSAASVENQGSITAAGNVVLISQQAINSGQISAGGATHLAAGSQVLLQQANEPGITVRVTGDGQVSNSGTIQSALVQLQANGGNAMALAINNTGIVRATGVKTVGGHIFLTGGPAAQVQNSGTLDASSATGKGGKIVVTGQSIAINSGSQLNANGATGGGQVLVGGSWKNENPAIPQAQNTFVASGAMLQASATKNGDGGAIVARSDVNNPASITQSYGTFRADAAGSGSGGSIETSGYSLDTAGISVSASAPAGHTGQWLLDPFNVFINSTTTANINESGSPWIPTASGGNVNVADITSTLAAGTDVTISTGSSGADLGNIEVDAAIAKSSGASPVTLTLLAANNITINQPITSTSGALNLVFDAQQSVAGAIILGSNLSTNGGSIQFGTGRTSGGNLIGGDVYLNGASAQTITTNGGNVTIAGQMLIANASGLTITTNGGAVNFQSTVDSGDSYQLVSSAVTWDNARILAQGATGGAAAIGDTYLATVTSSLEDTIASAAANYGAAWLGGHRVIGIGTNAVWRWVTGPEGAEDSGNGLQFFTENSGSGGGTAINGAYNNWNTGEPNNSGGANINANGESAIQFIGVTGKWNDLSESSPTLGYLVETNLTPSPLHVNTSSSGSPGQVTFAGLVGGNKPLSSLTVTGPVALNGGGVTTTTGQTYNNPVTLGSTSTTLTVTAGDLNFTPQLSYSNVSPGTLVLQASGNIVLNSGSSISAAGSTLTTALISNSNDGAQGNIQIVNSTIGTNGGDIFMNGGNGDFAIGDSGAGTIAAGSGVFINQSTIASAGGDITIGGRGSLTSAPVGAAGVMIEFGSTINSGNGEVLIQSTGPQGAASQNTGVDIRYQNSLGAGGVAGTTGSTVTATNGTASAITIAGVGSLTGATSSPGLKLENGSSITATTAGGGITLDGSGSVTNDATNNGIFLDAGTTVSTSNGSIVLNANAPALASSIADSGAGSRAITVGGGGNILDLHVITGGGVSLPDTTITTDQLLLGGGGPFTLTSSTNAFNTLAGNVTAGAVQVTNSHTITVDTVNSVVGLTNTAGAVTLVAQGATSDVVLNQPVSATGSGTSAVVAAGRNFLNFAGASGIAPGTGSFLVYSTDPASDNFDSLAGGHYYHISFGDTLPTLTGNQYLFSTQPTLTFTPDNQVKTYGDSNPTLTYSFGGLIGGDTIGQAATGTPTLSTAVTSATGIGVYDIDAATGTLASSIGYAIAFGTGHLTVGKAPLSIFADNQSRVYGQANPTFTVSTLGLVNGDSLSTATTGSPSITTTAIGTSGVNAYPISIATGTLASANYSLTLVPGSLSVTPATLFLTADDQTKVYGTANPTLTFSPSGLVNSDTLGSVSTGSPTLSTSATNISTVGAYDIDINTGTFAANSNYSVTLVDGTLHVTQATLNVTADAQTKVYGQTNPTLTFNFSGFVSGDSLGSGVSGAPTISTTATDSSGVGNYPITLGTGSIVAANYSLNLVNANLSVTPAPLTLTADNQTRTYGQANPALTFSTTGLVNGDSVSTAFTGSPSVTTSASPTSSVANYNIDISTGSLVSANYSVSFAGANLAVTPALLTFTAQDQTRLYGQSNSALTYNVTGLVNGDAFGSVATGAPTLATTASSTSGVGNYDLAVAPGTVTTLNSNYSTLLVDGNISVTPAPLTITANNLSRDAGLANPPLTATYTGLVAGDARSAISGLTLHTTANSKTFAGDYPIVAAGATDPNYDITLVNGTLSVISDFALPASQFWETTIGLTPNFPSSAIITSAVPIAQTGTAVSTAASANNPNNPNNVNPSATLGSGQYQEAIVPMGHLYYRQRSDQAQGGNGKLITRGGKILNNAMTHVSSFDAEQSQAGK
jgi:filamentous hemagglutinin family protein